MAICNPGERRRLALCLAAALCASGATHAATDAAAPASGPIVELRYRFENVDDSAFTREADANTVRLRLGYRWVFAPHWQLYADGERVQPLGAEHYNNTANGQTQYPVVVDPASTEINQAYVAFTADGPAAALGRQRLQLDNQRFFGNSGWRQNEQTFDAAALRYAFVDGGPTLRYLYLDRVLRVNGHDNPDPLLREWDLQGHLLHVDQALPLGALAGYAYLVENRSIATLSTQTYGLRWIGTKALGPATLGWTLEYATQSNWRNNPLQQQADYALVEPTVSWHGITFKAGREQLGGDGDYGFATPYATLHAFNGWADRFLVTPKGGLDDRYLGAAGKLGAGMNWVATWHDFGADRGGQHYGSEIDLSLGRSFGTHWNALVKYADYRADGFGSSLRKLWLSCEYIY
jgi:hypothetical protein